MQLFAWSDRCGVNGEALVVRRIGRAALLKNERASGRDKDLRDVAVLEQLGDLAGNSPRPRKRAPRASTRRSKS